MDLNFSKMHAQGNDFMVIDTINQDIGLTKKQIANLSLRRTGIGFDQCLIIEKTSQKNIDFNYRIFNTDGSESGQCGNGARCIAHFIKDKNLSSKKELSLLTHNSILHTTINDDKTISVNLGKANFNPQDIPLSHTEQDTYSLTLKNKQIINFHALSLGNPHALICVDDVSTVDVDNIGSFFNQQSIFPEGVNLGFIQLIDQDSIKLRVFERGVGETPACGSNAAAAGICARTFYKCSEHIKVELPGGDLNIHYKDKSSPVVLTAKTYLVYDGIIAV